MGWSIARSTSWLSSVPAVVRAVPNLAAVCFADSLAGAVKIEKRFGSSCLRGLETEGLSSPLPVFPSPLRSCAPCCLSVAPQTEALGPEVVGYRSCIKN